MRLLGFLCHRETSVVGFAAVRASHSGWYAACCGYTGSLLGGTYRLLHPAALPLCYLWHAAQDAPCTGHGGSMLVACGAAWLGSHLRRCRGAGGVPPSNG
jgi:hypothetical protein